MKDKRYEKSRKTSERQKNIKTRYAGRGAAELGDGVIGRLSAVDWIEDAFGWGLPFAI